LLETLSATTKAAIATAVPGLGVAIAGWDAYNRAKLDQSVGALISQLQAKTDDLQKLMDSQWLKSPEGQQFSWKVVDAALDVQLIDKQEFFANAFVNGVQSQGMAELEKLKFLDMLRHLSLTSLVVLSEMDKMFAGQVRRPKKHTDPTGAFPLVDAEAIAESLTDKYHPYLVMAAVKELESEGLFSRIGEWTKMHDQTYRKGGGFMTELCYTDFSARFADFIRSPREQSA
jgi:hypothetical protein